MLINIYIHSTMLLTLINRNYSEYLKIGNRLLLFFLIFIQVVDKSTTYSKSTILYYCNYFSLLR